MFLKRYVDESAKDRSSAERSSFGPEMLDYNYSSDPARIPSFRNLEPLMCSVA